MEVMWNSSTFKFRADDQSTNVQKNNFKFEKLMAN